MLTVQKVLGGKQSSMFSFKQILQPCEIFPPSFHSGLENSGNEFLVSFLLLLL
jgi:hypothetical protein